MKAILEQVAVGRERSIYAFEYEGSQFDAPWHFHPQYELTYITTSVGTRFIGDYVGSYQPGELVLLGANLPHCWKTVRNPHQLAKSTVVQWNEGIFPEVPELENISAMLRKAAYGLQFEYQPSTCVPLLTQLVPSQGQEVYTLLLELLLYLATCSSKPLSESTFTAAFSRELSTKMAKIHDFVERAYQRKIRLQELAQLVNMSEQSFSRFFSRVMGRPFFVFLNEYRINTASRLLLTTDWSITQIGFACGYESASFFHQQFHKFKQETPLQYRKRYSRI